MKKATRFIILISLGIILTLTSFDKIPQGIYSEYRKISSGYGPEDMVVDTLSEIHSILISCSSRRTEYGEYGEIERFLPGMDTTEILKRIGEPENLVFKPHGIHISSQNGKAFLYVICHDDELDDHFIAKYLIESEQLVFVKIFKSPELVSPNALFAFNDGSLIVCNDAKKRNALYEKIFKLKTSNIVMMNAKEEWKVLADKIAYAAGLGYSEGKVYVSATLENKIYSYDYDGKTLKNKEKLMKIKGPDNLRFYKGNILVAGHLSSISFIRHVKNKDKYSPGTVFLIDKISSRSNLLFSNKGDIISANSTAVIFNNKLYINQVFDPWIIEINLSEKF